MDKGRRRKKKTFMDGLMFSICLIFIIGAIACPIWMRSVDLREQEQTYIRKEAELQEQIEAEERRTEELEQRKKYVGTDQYIEEIARDRLGLIDPDEVLIQADDN